MISKSILFSDAVSAETNVSYTECDINCASCFTLFMTDDWPIV